MWPLGVLRSLSRVACPCAVCLRISERLRWLTIFCTGAEASLVRQATDPRFMQLLNFGGFGMAAWDEASVGPSRPFLYRAAGVPMFDRNLKALCEKVCASALLAHVRGVIYEPAERVGAHNVHPFLFRDAAFALAQNGDLFDFGRMRYDLLRHIPPELTAQIEGTTDTEWFYALCLAQLDDPFAPCRAEEMAGAVCDALRIVQRVRERRGIETQSPINLVLTDGRSLVATRYVFDYGWYPHDGSFFAGEREHDFTTLWYTIAPRLGQHSGDGPAARIGVTTALVIASEPLTEETSSWLTAPEYSMLVAQPDDRGAIDVRLEEIVL
jgi:glutamine amidotransferase